MRQLAVIDHLADFAAKLKLVARVVDGPRHISTHQHAFLDRTDHFFKRRRAGFDIQIRHAVYWRAIPGARTGSGYALDGRTLCSRASLGNGAAKRAFENAVFDNERFLCGGAVIVEREAGKLVRHARVKSHIQQWRSILISAKHVQCHEAGAGKIALVTQYAIELKRVADRFVDLQHHLVRHQDYVHRARWAVGRAQQCQCVLRCLPATPAKARPLDDLHAALLAKTVVAAAKRARLRFAVRKRGYGERRHHEIELLFDQPAICRYIELFRVRGPECSFPVLDAVIDFAGG